MAFVHQARCRVGQFNELAKTTEITVTPTELWRPTQCKISKSCQTCDCGAGRQKVPLLGSKICSCYPPHCATVGNVAWEQRALVLFQCSITRDTAQCLRQSSRTECCVTYGPMSELRVWDAVEHIGVWFRQKWSSQIQLLWRDSIAISTFQKIHLTMRCPRNPVLLHHDVSQKSDLRNKL
jgi:hypothetical protein